MFDDFNDVPFDVEEYSEDADSVMDLYKESEEQTGPIDTVTANYYVGIVRKNKEKEAEYKEQAKAMLEDFKYKVDAWLRKRQTTLDYSTQLCLAKLEEYYRANQPANGKSISLPEGHIGFYSVAEKYSFDENADMILKTLEDTEGLKQFVRYTPSINKVALKKACSFHDGQVFVGETLIPGATYTPKTTEFKARQ